MKNNLDLKFTRLLFCIFIAYISIFSNPVFSAENNIKESSSDENSRSQTNSQIADLIAEDFLNSLDDKPNGFEAFILPRLKLQKIELPAWTKFEDVVLDYYIGLSPSYRQVDDLADALLIRVDQAERLLLYYNLDDSPYDLNLGRGEGARIYSALQAEKFEKENEAVITYLKESIRSKPVSIMAADLGLTEGELYKKAWLLDIGFEEQWSLPYENAKEVTAELATVLGVKEESVTSFADPLSIVQALIDQGVDAELIISQAYLLKVDSKALENILHYTGYYQTGRVWEDWEVKILRDNYGEWPASDVAAYLQRSEASVRAKAAEIGLTQPIEAKLFHHPHGVSFKEMTRQQKRNFLLEHNSMTHSDLAQLGSCSPTTIQSWRIKLRVFGLRKQTAKSKTALSQKREELGFLSDLKERYKLQEEYIDRFVSHFLQTGEFLAYSKFSTYAGTDPSRLVGLGIYKDSTKAIFPNSDAFYVAAIRAIKKSRPTFSIFDTHIETTEATSRIFNLDRLEVQERILARALSHLAETGELLTDAKCKAITGFDWTRLFGIEDYDPNQGRFKERHIFPDRLTFWTRFFEIRRSRLHSLKSSKDSHADELNNLHQGNAMFWMQKARRGMHMLDDVTVAQLAAPDRAEEQVRVINQLWTGFMNGEIPPLQIETSKKYLKMAGLLIGSNLNSRFENEFEFYKAWLDQRDQYKKSLSQQDAINESTRQKLERANSVNFLMLAPLLLMKTDLNAIQNFSPLIARDRSSAQEFALEKARAFSQETGKKIKPDELAKLVGKARKYLFGSDPRCLFPSIEDFYSRLEIAIASPELSSKPHIGNQCGQSFAE